MIELYFNRFLLGTLTYKDKRYTFKQNEESEQLLLKAGVTLAKFESNKREITSYTLPLVFEKFIPTEPEKIKLLEQLGISEDDHDYIKLQKISNLPLEKNGFWLKTVE